MSEQEKYEVLEKIGHGSFGIIRKVRRKGDGYILCRKEISYLQMSAKEREQLQSELSILKGLRHPNIVAYYEREHIKTSSDLHIYMEYCQNGDLGKYIRELKRSSRMADEDFVWSVFSQLVTALYRCHYGEDAPEVGGNVIGLSNDAKPLRSKASHAMILHRDLKPENIFLGSDASVKLGDFGLSKIMQSHDFASTYVGTPFYMSPEICAAEQYSLHSDIWAFGCIMYELCAKEPPFNAKTHMELIQRIRQGRITPLSSVYSNELKEAISKCLRVNPTLRPDTVQLLNIPMVKLKRKEIEIVKVGKQLKLREEQAARTLQEADSKLAKLEAGRQMMRSEIENTVRREWEVKARLEIDRQVQLTRDQLQNDFESELKRRMEEDLQRRAAAATYPRSTSPVADPIQHRSSTPALEDLHSENPTRDYYQSQSTTGETDDFPSSTDLSELSLESPTIQRTKSSSKRTGRTPFTRAHTMFENSPFDVSMADPSPAPVNSLGLSPRRQATRPIPRVGNIFAAAAGASRNFAAEVLEEDADDDDDDVPNLPSPTRGRNTGGDPFKAMQTKRPALSRQKTAPQKQGTFSTLAARGKENSNPSLISGPLFSKPTNSTVSPPRRLSKYPSTTSLASDPGSPRRTAPAAPTSPQRRPHSRKAGDNADMRQAAMLNNHVQGRTLVELAQAHAPSAGISVQDFANDSASSDVSGGDSASKSADTSPAVWDPERDEMPSPFLAKKTRSAGLPSVVTGPAMTHIR